MGELDGWEFRRRYLMRHVRFSPRLGEKPREINAALGTHAPQQTAWLFDGTAGHFEAAARWQRLDIVNRLIDYQSTG
jgi:hypothetical protein